MPNYIKFGQHIFRYLDYKMSWTDRQTDRQPDRQTDRQTNKVTTYPLFTILVEAKKQTNKQKISKANTHPHHTPFPLQRTALKRRLFKQ